jgi:hypothetical protein
VKPKARELNRFGRDIAHPTLRFRIELRMLFESSGFFKQLVILGVQVKSCARI